MVNQLLEDALYNAKGAASKLNEVGSLIRKAQLNHTVSLLREGQDYKNQLQQQFVVDLKKCLSIYAEHGTEKLVRAIVDLASQHESRIDAVIKEQSNGTT